MLTFLLGAWKPIAAVVGVALLAIAVIAVIAVKRSYDEGKRTEGRAEVQALWDADRARNIAEGRAQEQRWRNEREATETAALEAGIERGKRMALSVERVRVLPAAVSGARVDRSAVRVLNDAIAADAGNSTKTARSAAKPVQAAPAAAEGADSSVGLMTEWGVQCIAAYDEARGMVRGWQAFYAGLQAGQQSKAEP